jgi:hypothetical protein
VREVDALLTLLRNSRDYIAPMPSGLLTLMTGRHTRWPLY